MILLLNIFIIIGLLFLGHKCSRRSELGVYYWSAITLKILAGILVGLVYKFYYHGGDTFSFFESEISIRNIGFASWQNFTDIFFRNNYQAVPDFYYTWIPSAFFVKLLSFFALLTNDNYWLTGIYLSLFSFCGLWVWTLSLWKLTQNRKIAVISGLFIPSILFWSSGVMKESLAIPALAALSALFINWYTGATFRWKYIVVGIVLFSLLALTKYFLAAVFLATTAAIFISRKLLPEEGKKSHELVILLLVFLLLGGLVSGLHPNLWPSRIAEVIFNNYRAYQNLEGYAVTYTGFQPNILSILVHQPKAIAVGIFWPLIPLKSSALSLAAVLENWLIVFGIVAMFINLRMSNYRQPRLLHWGGLLFVIVSAGMIALSTPNLGTLARYKTGYLLVFAPYLVSGIIMSYRKFVTKG